MKIAVTGSSGLVGTPLVRALRAEGHQVVRLVRRDPRAEDEARWDPAAGVIDTGALAGIDGAVNLAGAGLGDKRWNDAYKREILDSRVKSTRTLATAMAELDPRPTVLVSGSAIGVYGDRGDEQLTEDSARGTGYLADVAGAWEDATAPASAAGIRVATIRTGLVMSASGGAFGRLLPLVKLGVGGRLGSGRQWWSWVTLTDEVRAISFLLDHEVSGPVNVTGPTPVTNAAVVAALGRAAHRPTLFPVPAVALRTVVGEFADDILASQRVLPTRLLDSGFEFTHADVDSAARSIV